MAFAQQLDPALLQQLADGGNVPGWSATKYGNQFSNGESGDGLSLATPNAGQIAGYTYKDPSKEWYTTFDESGRFLNEGDGRNKMTAKDLAMFAAAVYGAGSLGSAFGGPGWSFGGAAPGVTYSPGAVQSSITGLTDTLGGIAPASSSMIPAASFNVAPAVGAADAGGAAGAAGAAGASAPGASSWLAKALSGAGSLGNVIGAALGAASARDQEQSANQTSTSKTSKDPYAPAKPFIDQMIGQGQQLAAQYQQQPFSQAQQTAYNNLGGLLNAINGGVGGLMQGMGAASSGANNFDRANPRKALQGGGFDLSGWAPGLLQFFGGKG